MKVFFDTEFTELSRNGELISIGFVSEDNRQFYAEFTDFGFNECNDWIKENVLPNLYMRKTDECPYIQNYHVGTKYDIAIALKNWFTQFDFVELVSDVCHYDMVFFIDMFGNAFNLPENVCPSCYDINQDIAWNYVISQNEAFNKSREEILKEHGRDCISGDKHNSLYDAKVIRELYQILNDVDFYNVDSLT